MPLSMLANDDYPKYYDSEKLEKYTSWPTGKDTLLAEWPHNKSVSAAYWDPRGRSILSTSYDDNLRSKSSLSLPLNAAESSCALS